MQMLYHFCSITPPPDDVPKSGRKRMGTNYLWNFYQPIPVGYHKIDLESWKAKYKNTQTENVYIV